MDRSLFFPSQVLLLMICVLGFIANALTLAIFLRKGMRSSTNYFLLGLTFSDICLLTLHFFLTLDNFLPIATESDSSQFPPLIYIWDLTCTGGTRYFTAAVSLERCFKICWPLHSRAWITTSRARIAAAGVLLFNLLMAVGCFVYEKYAHEYGFQLFAAVEQHFVPLVLIVVLNVIIYVKIREYNKSRKALTVQEVKEISLTKSLLCVVLVFGICDSFETLRRILNYTNYFDLDHFEYYDYTINYLADVFYMLNSAVNFIIYYLMVKEFRTELSSAAKFIMSAIPRCKAKGATHEFVAVAHF